MAIFGSSNLSDSGDLLIFNKVSYKTLLMFEKELGRDRMTYLVEEGLPPDTATASHLESTKADGILFQAGGSDPVALRSAIMERINEGRRVVFLPGPVSHVKGSISQIPPRVIKALEALHISPVPVYAGFYTNSVLDAEADTDAQADIQIHILPKLAPGAEMAARLTSAWLECSAQAYATLPQLHGSLSALLFRSLKLHSDCRVIDGIDDTTLTYGQLLAISVAFAKRLKKITSNRRVGIILPPGKGAAIANLGCLFAGKTPVNFNYSASEGAFASSVKQSGVDWFITADTFMRKLQNFPWPPQRDLILMEREIPLLKGSAKRWGLAIKFLTAGFMIKKLGLDAPTGADEAVLMFTSGSSGEPKGVPLTHHNLLSNISQCSSRITLEPQSRFLGSLPVFHCFGITIGLWYPMIGGYDMVTYPSPLEAKRLGTLIKQYGISLVVTTPTFLRGFMKRCEPDTFKTVRYLIVGAEKLPEDLSAAFREKFGIIPCEGYGLTEASPVCSVNFIDPAPSNAAGDFIPGMKKSSVGALLPGIAIRITSPHTGRVVPITTSGMIWLKGPNIFPGYLGGPETDRDIFVDGWLKTGDIGSADEFGFLKIEGRMKTALYVATVARTYRKAIDDYMEAPEKYKANMSWYQEQISNCTYRQFTTGFFYGKPDEHTQIYDNNTYVKEYTYLGYAEEVDENGFAHITQRNKFTVGEMIEIMKPDGRNITATVRAIYDEDGNSVESAPHPQQKLAVDLGTEIEKYDLLRRAEA